jgi:lipopolysaccharide export system protein LptA
MARWQRHARLGLGLFAIAFAATLWLVIGDRRQNTAVEPVERLDPKAASEIRGGDAVQVKGAKRDVRVEFANQVLYTDGRTKYTAFKAFIDDRGGRSFVVSGNEAWLGKDLSAYDLSGDVALKTSDGLSATTRHATFSEAEGILKGEGPIQFQRGRVTGSGVGFTYDRNLDRLWLLDKAVINVAPGNDANAMHITSSAAGYSRTERYMRFERGMRLEREGQVMEAEHGTIFLLKDRDEPDVLELRGNSKITGAGGTSSLQGMQAADINLNYGADGRTLEQAVLMRQASLQLARADGSPAQQLSADFIEALLAPDGTVSQLHGRDNARVTIPATAETGARTVTAPLVNGTGASGRGLTAMNFDNGVEYREDAFKDKAARVARARALKAAMLPDGAIDQADFSENFRFEEGATRAASTHATYNVTKGTLALRGAAGAPPPHIEDARVVLDAASIDVTLSPRQLLASGKVSAEFRPGRREGERGTTLLSEKEPVFVNSEKFAFDEATGAGTYSGKALLWQKQSATQIRAETIALNEKTGMLAAAGNAVTTLPIAGNKDGATPGTSLGRAAEFQFDDAKRRAVFVKQAQLEGVQGNLRADRIELFLAPRDNTLQRIEGDGAVEALVEQRRATGHKMTYHPDEEKYVMAGTPVRLVQGCQESTGRTLTFYRASDRILVDGNQEIRVQLKGGSCPDAPPPY